MKNFKKIIVPAIAAIALCISLIAGATYAWFTDEAKTNVNKIQSGKLDVALEMSMDNGATWTTAEGQTLSFLKMNAEGELVADENVLWEPGCTYKLPLLRVINNGNLALKYKVALSGATGDLNLLEAISFTANITKDGADTATTMTGAYGSVLAESMLKPETDGVKSFDTIALEAKMDENAGNEYMNLTIENIAITVYATQAPVEYDSNGNEYDKDALLGFVVVKSTEELKGAFKNARAGENINVSLASDVVINNNELSVVNETQSGIGVGVGDIYIKANGHTIKTTNNGTRCVKIECADTARTITIVDAKIVSESTVGNTSENRGVQIFSVKNATINLVNCEIEMKSNDYSYAVKVAGTSENLVVNITGCTLTSANCIESFGKNCTFNISDCVFNSNYAPNATYCGNGIQDKNGTNNTYNIKNTVFNGTNAQPWQKSATTTINDLGGNVNKTTRTQA